MNATKNGLLPIVLSLSARQVLAALAPDERIAIDLPKQHVTVKQTVYPFEIDATWKHKLVNGLDEIGITLQEEEKITAYEKQSSLSPQLKTELRDASASHAL